MMSVSARARSSSVAELDIAGSRSRTWKFSSASSVHYWASPLEGKLCAGQEVALVGGGNSAGQAVVYLASQVAKVWLLVRGPELEASMSRYLVDRIAGLPNVEVVTQARISGLAGSNGMLEAISWRQGASREEELRPIRHLFLFIGAEPNTDWLSGSGVALGRERIRVDRQRRRRRSPPAGDKSARRLCRRRRPVGFSQARCRGGRRGRPSGSCAACLSGAAERGSAILVKHQENPQRPIADGGPLLGR